jgi:hypothetical protein
MVTVVLLSSFVVVFGFAVSIAHSRQDNAAGNSDERKVENTVSEKVPVKVKVKDEKSLKDKKNKNWARELEIEVKNTGNKRLYYVNVEILMPDIVINGGTFVLRMVYGRKKLLFPDEPLVPEDKPIMPGESITLKIPEGQVKAYEGGRDEDKIYSDPERVEIVVHAVRTDDTYFFQSGQSFHAGPKEKSANDLRPEGEPSRCKPEPGGRMETNWSWGHSVLRVINIHLTSESPCEAQ